MKRGVELAIKEINDQGLRINGTTIKLEMVAVDDQADPKKAQATAQQLVDAGVVAVVGHFNSGVSIEASPVYAAKGIPQLSISTKPDYNSGKYPTTLRLVANDAVQARAIGSYAARYLHAERFGFIDDGTPYGTSLAGAAVAEVTKLNKKLVLRRSVDDKTTDFARIVEEIKGTKTQVLVSTLNAFQLEALIDQLNAAGLTDLTIMASDTAKTDALRASASKVRALYVTSPMIEPRELPSGVAFVDRFRAAYKEEPFYAAAYAYDATHLIAAAIRHSERYDADTINKALRSIDALAPATQAVRFRPDGEQHYAAVGVYTVRSGRWEALIRTDAW